MPNQLEWEKYTKEFSNAAKAHHRDDHYIERCLAHAKLLFEQGMPIIFTPSHFCHLVGYSPEYVMGVSNAADNYYRHFSIAKRSGGEREIAEPLPSLKEIQKWILRNILYNIDVSRFAKAYTKKESIKSNARFHKGQRSVLCLDIEDFFGSIHGGYVYRIFRRLGFRSSVSTVLTNLCVLDGSIPQGAPTSPALSNIVMNDFDNRVSQFCIKRKIRYTRYADDMTFSGDIKTGEIVGFIAYCLQSLDMTLNPKKTRVMGQGQQQKVTGVIVNEKLQAPRTVRKKLRKSVYYIKKFGLDSHINHEGIKQSNYVHHLIGIANYILFINPNDKDAAHALQILKPLL